MHTIGIAGIVISILAVFVCVFLYFLDYRGESKRQYLTIVGILNFIISLSMLFIVIFSLLTPLSNGALSDSILLPGIVIVGLFVVGQAIYLASAPTSPMKRRRRSLHASRQGKQREVGLLPVSKIDKLVERFHGHVRNNVLEYFRIVLMAQTEAEIQQKILAARAYNELQTRTPLDEYSRPRESQDAGLVTDPLDIFDKEYERQVEQAEKTQNLLKILTRESRNYCVILGEPGIGKTTFMKYLALQVASKAAEVSAFRDFLPIYISLHEFAAYSSGRLEEFIVSKFNVEFENEFEKLFDTKRNQKKVLLLLDGLDEAYTGETKREAGHTYEDVRKAISQFAQENPEIHIIVTCRTAAYEDGQPLTGSEREIFKTVEKAGLIPEDVKDFIGKRLPSDEVAKTDKAAKRLVNIIELDQRLRELSTNPLLLKIIVDIFTSHGNASHSRHELYRQSVEDFIVKWDKMRGVDRYNDFGAEEKKALLGKLAFEYHRSNDRKLLFGEQDLLKKIEEFLQDIKINKNRAMPILQEIITNSGLLTKFSQSLYGFTHFVFQEFFAAQYCVNQVRFGEENINSVLYYWGDFWWEEVILMIAAYFHDAEALLEQLKKIDDIFSTTTILSGRSLATQHLSSNAEKFNQNQVVEIITNLFQALSTTRYIRLANDVVKTLVELADPKVNMRLFKLIELDLSSDKQKQVIILNSLGQWGYCRYPHGEQNDESHKKEYDELIDYLKSLLQDQILDVNIRRIVPRALEALEGLEIVDYMIEYLEISDKNDTMPRQWGEDKEIIALEMIKSLKRLRAVKKIENLCLYLKQPPHILRKGRSIPSIDIAKEIAKTLGILGLQCKDNDVRKLLVKTLLNILEDPEQFQTQDQVRIQELQIECISALAKSKSYSMLVSPSLLRLLNRENQEMAWPVRSRIMLLLVMLEAEQLVSSKNPDGTLLRLLTNKPVLTDEHAELSHLLFDLLYSHPTRKDRSPSQDRSQIARLELLHFIEEHRASIFVPALVEMLYRKEIDTTLRVRIADILGELGDEEEGEQLITRLSDDDLIIRADGSEGRQEIIKSHVVIALGNLYDAGKVKGKSLESLVNSLEKMIGDETTGIELLASCSRTIHQLGSKAKKLYEAVEKALLYRDVDLPYPERYIVLGDFGKDFLIPPKNDEHISDKLIELVYIPEKLSSIQDISNLQILKKRSKEAGEALTHLYNVRTQLDNRRWEDIQQKLLDRLLDSATKSIFRPNIARVLIHMDHTMEQCKVLADQLMNPNLPQEMLDCVFDTVWEISRRMKYKVCQNQETQAIKIKRLGDVLAGPNHEQ